MTKRDDSDAEPTREEPAHGSSTRGRPRRTETGAIQYEAIRLHFRGMTNEAIARRLGRSSKTVGRWLRAPDVQRVIGRELEQIAAKLWADIGAETDSAWQAFVRDLYGDDPRIAQRARTWLLERILEIMPMARLIDRGLLADEAVPPDLQLPLEEDA